jgi:hypothetical protein
MKVKDKEKLNNPLKDWQILSSISSMVFHTVQCSVSPYSGKKLHECTTRGRTFTTKKSIKFTKERYTNRIKLLKLSL